jgi:hypothetical protein
MRRGYNLQTIPPKETGPKRILKKERIKWITAQCARASEALKLADQTLTDTRLWKEADRAVAEFSRFCPQIALAHEIAKFIRALPSLLPDLWDITASYATSHEEARCVGASKFIWLRIGCLYMSDKFESARLLQSNMTLPTKEETLNLHDWGVRLFYGQRFSEAKCIFEKLSTDVSKMNMTLCLIFAGDFDGARISMQYVLNARARHGDSFGGWIGIARAMLATYIVERNDHLRTTISSFLVEPFQRTFAQNLLRYHCIDFDDSAIRDSFALAVAQIRESNGNFSIPCLTQTPQLVPSDFIRRDKNKRLRVISVFNAQ